MTTEDTAEIAVVGTAQIAVPDQIAQELAQAQNLADYQHLIQKYDVARIAAERAARLLQSRGNPLEVVRATKETAEHYAAGHLAAEAEAGRLANRMIEESKIVRGGELLTGRGEAGGRRGRKLVSEDQLSTWQEILGTETANAARVQVHNWRKVAAIPDNIREEYVDDAREKGVEITTKGLIHFAAEPKPEPEPKEALAQIYGEVAKALGTIVQYDAVVVAGYASNNRKKSKFKALVGAASSWLDKVDAIYQRPEDEATE